ncbi:PREDICTED: uncharacterized protein LOC100197852 [Paramuricea clavata]|uniref:PREDICTED: uncharacterized protein LOC100197852 n=1 Tax=Paramuricea clavata TaxID=317549 RepID=A0A6S7I1W1_PARCT|nr:PREDICTED: uncharacterized protein LOC100197852 [Paramuricea clavata]
MHHGVETTLARIRSKYWIVEGRRSVKQMLRKCVVCTRVQGLPMRAPPSPDLPDFRVDHSGHAFQATGLDFAGPLFVKGDLKHEKTYILLLTCATSRAVHLELVPDMSIGGFLRGFKRFMARRGSPDVIIHDNFKTFKAAATVLCEIEMAINNRPLAYVSDDDLDDALTPHHLIHGRNAFKQAKAIDFVPTMDLEKCKRRLLHVRKVLRDCWARFRCSYLNELRQMNIYRKTKGENTRRISVGDVVLIKDNEISVRTQWRMGKVLELVKGRDGQIRGAKLKVLSKKGKQTAVFRPLQRLIPFEINENHDCMSEQQQKESNDSVDKDENVNEPAATVNEETSAKRPTRKAAVEGQNLRRLREQYN